VGAVAAGALLSVLPACDEANPLAVVCCTEFKVGADLSALDFGLTGEIRGQFLAFAQAASDLASTANEALLDVQAACRDIALELGAPATDIEAAERHSERQRATELCRLAVTQINTRVTARARLDVSFMPPVCEISVKHGHGARGNAGPKVRAT
jgi:hypothetical protein